MYETLGQLKIANALELGSCDRHLLYSDWVNLKNNEKFLAVTLQASI